MSGDPFTTLFGNPWCDRCACRHPSGSDCEAALRRLGESLKNMRIVRAEPGGIRMLRSLNEMSWNREFHAGSKTTAKQEITRLQSADSHFPPAAAAVVVAAIDILPDIEGSAIFVKTTGHIGDNNGSAIVEVRIVNLL